MSSSAVAISFSKHTSFEKTLRQLSPSPLVDKIFVLHGSANTPLSSKCERIDSGSLNSGAALNSILKKVTSKYLLLVTGSGETDFGQFAFERFLTVAEETNSGMVYSDYYDIKDGERLGHPVNDYQFGSVRDNFDFGPVLLFSVPAIRRAIKKYGGILK